MDLEEAIYTRRAVRHYSGESVDEKTIQDLIRAAIQAPSAVSDLARSRRRGVHGSPLRLPGLPQFSRAARALIWSLVRCCLMFANHLSNNGFGGGPRMIADEIGPNSKSPGRRDPPSGLRRRRAPSPPKPARAGKPAGQSRESLLVLHRARTVTLRSKGKSSPFWSVLSLGPAWQTGEYLPAR